MDEIVWSEWHEGGPKAEKAGKWMFAFGTSQWGFDLTEHEEAYWLTIDSGEFEVIAGPFDSLEAAKAAYLLIGESKK